MQIYYGIYNSQRFKMLNLGGQMEVRTDDRGVHGGYNTLLPINF